MPWGAVIGAVGAVASGAMASNTADKNRDAAGAASQQIYNSSQPYNINSGGGLGGYGGSASFAGQNAASTAGTGLGSLQQGFFGNSGNFLNNLGNLSQTGGINPLLSGALSQYYNSVPNANPQGQQQLANGMLTGQGTQGQLGGMFAGSAAGALGQLGSFDPSSYGANYANLLGQQQAPANTLAANSLAQNLFNTGNLGSTGGANQFGQLQQSQQNQWVGDQLAGQQLGLQQQQTLGSLAGLFGNQSNSLLGSSFQQGYNLNNTLYTNQNNQAQQGFSNMLGLNTAGNQNLASQGSLAGSLFGSGMDINTYLQGLISQGSSLGANRAGTGTAAANTQLQGNLAANNTNGAVLQGLLGSLTNANWGGSVTGGQKYNDMYPTNGSGTSNSDGQMPFFIG